MTLGGGLLVAPFMSGAPTNETLRTIASLRTIHGDFSDKQIPDADIEQIVTASVRAANASALQSYSILLVRDPDMQRKICGYRGSCLLLYLVDYTRPIATAKRLGYDYAPGDMEAFVTGTGW